MSRAYVWLLAAGAIAAGVAIATQIKPKPAESPRLGASALSPVSSAPKLTCEEWCVTNVPVLRSPPGALDGCMRDCRIRKQ